MSLNRNLSLSVVGDLNPLITKAMLIDLIKGEKIENKHILEILTDYNILRITTIKKHKEEN